MAYANKRDEYPKDIHDMMDVMRQTKPVKKKTNSPKKTGDRTKKTPDGQPPPKTETSFLQQDKDGKKIECHCCGEPHFLKDCQKKDTVLLKDWHNPKFLRGKPRKRRGKSNAQASEKRDDEDGQEEHNHHGVWWSCHMVGDEESYDSDTSVPSLMDLRIYFSSDEESSDDDDSSSSDDESITAWSDWSSDEEESEEEWEEKISPASEKKVIPTCYGCGDSHHLICKQKEQFVEKQSNL